MSDLTVQPGVFRDNNKLEQKSVKGGVDFSDAIKNAINNVNDMKIEADRSVQGLIKGETGIHETMIALQKADISMRLLLQVRNKAMEAYREVMRMPF